MKSSWERPDSAPFAYRRAIVDVLREARERLAVQIELAGMEARDEWEEIELLAETGFRQARRILLFMAGITVVLFGTLLVFTPAPGSVVILGGLSILAAEFAWARRWRIQLEQAIAVALTRLRESLEALNDEV